MTAFGKQSPPSSPALTAEEQIHVIEEQRRIIAQLRAALELSRAALLEQKDRRVFPPLPPTLSRYAVGLRPTEVTSSSRKDWWEPRS